MMQVPPHNNDQRPDAADAVLVAALGGEEPAAMLAFADIYRKYSPRLIQYILPFLDDQLTDAKEVVQTVFIKLWEKREKLVGVKRISSYLFRMCRNATWDYKENQHLERQRALAIAAHSESSFDVADAGVEMRELEAEVVQALALLPERRRLIFLAYTREDLSLDQIAESMGISKDVVKKQLHLATRFLKDHVAEKTRKNPGIAFLLFFF